MSESYEDKKRMSEEHFRAATFDKPEETTPPQITAPINTFATRLGAEPARYIPVMKDPVGLFGWCSDGVLEKIKNDGGSIRFGWTIWEWPRVLLTGEFHAAWVNPAGELIDITPKPHGEDRILFIPDSSYPADFDFDQRPPNKRQRLYQPTDPSAEIAAHIARMKPAQRAYEERRAAKVGVTLEQSLRDKRPVDSKVQIIDDFIGVCDEYDRELDTTPGMGYVQATPRLRALLTRKLRLQEQLKRGR